MSLRALPSLLLLAACAGDKPAPGDTAADTGGAVETCSGAPTVTIVSPQDDYVGVVGERVSLEATVTSSVGDPVQSLWAVDGDVEVVGATGGWTPDAPGNYELGFQAEDRCGITQEFLNVRIEGDGDTGDTGDTATPAAEGITAFGTDVGVPAGGWKGLSVGPDGVLWGATSSGLVRLDPEVGTARVYGTADGLLSDEPQAVLAHSDGTVWIGHLGDTERQGEQVSVAEDGTLTVLQSIDYTESTEILAVVRLAEQVYGDGAGDVWMGTNEGVCLWDADVGVFAEHAHPTHPHGYTEGVAVTAEGDVWNGDAYQLSRWRYSNDGDLSPSADLLETVATWPVQLEEPIEIADLSADGDTLWVASELFGVARVTVGAEVGTSQVDLLEPTAARAIGADGTGLAWIGTSDGLYVSDGVTALRLSGEWLPADGVEEIAIDRSTAPPTVWLGTSAGLVRVVGVPGT